MGVGGISVIELDVTCVSGHLRESSDVLGIILQYSYGYHWDVNWNICQLLSNSLSPSKIRDICPKDCFAR